VNLGVEGIAAMRDKRQLLDLTFRLIQRMADLSRGAGARFVVLLHPNRRALEADEPLVEVMLRARELAGIRVFDLGREYQVTREWSDLLLDASGHLNAEGHRAAAAAIRRILERLS
jgi:hypothetical protein